MMPWAVGGGELLRWIQLIVCASIFLALVVAKINMPARFESLRALRSLHKWSTVWIIGRYSVQWDGR